MWVVSFLMLILEEQLLFKTMFDMNRRDQVFLNMFLKKSLLPSGKHTKSFAKLPFIVDLPIENGDFP